MQTDRNRRLGRCLGAGMLITSLGLPAAAQQQTCRKMVLAGEVGANQEWRAAFGQGWVFRLVPIQPGNAGYSGWDLVVDRDPPAGFPDALLVATPPYNSINEREVGTTFGLRAQDAIGWNPRSFRFLTTPEGFHQSRQLYLSLSGDGQIRLAEPASTPRNTSANKNLPAVRATQRLMQLERQSSAGQFRILDARLAPGVSDAASYAENWALASPKTRHTLESSTTGKSTPLGELHWIQFSITLWLPASWKTPAALHATRAACSE